MSSESTIERVRAEGMMPISKAARKFTVHPATLSRWANKGYKLADGRTVKLETVRTPGKLLTSEAAVTRFLNTIALPLDAIHTPNRSPIRRRMAADAAGQELSAMGV